MTDQSSVTARPGPGALPADLPSPDAVTRARQVGWALRIGALIWLFLLVVGFFAPGGWVWGLPGPIGHMENYLISLWFVGLVLAPLLASRDPLHRPHVIQIYLLAVLAIVASTIRGEPPKLISDAPPIAAAIIAAGLVVWTYPRRSMLLRG
ncbi:MAG: hypothetical protein IT305_18780 [Chloroflexi bacterium]|nr:hypothetical protein [Chloroflexota bacterium]